jgi:hypothetical protein
MEELASKVVSQVGSTSPREAVTEVYSHHLTPVHFGRIGRLSNS